MHRVDGVGRLNFDFHTVSDRRLRVLRAERVERRQRPLFVARFMAPEAATRRIELLTNPRDVLPHLAFTDRTVADFLDRFPDRRRSQLRELLVDDLDGRRDVLAEDVVVNDQRRGARKRGRGDEDGERSHPCHVCDNLVALGVKPTQAQRRFELQEM